MIDSDVLVNYVNQLLSIANFKDYGPNGLQVGGKREIGHIVSGVTASQALIKAAIAQGADTLLVHHGIFWNNDSPCLVGWKRQRIKLLLEHNLNLLAYHLPLDAHALYGNNVQLAKQFNIKINGPLNPAESIPLGLQGEFIQSLKPKVLIDYIHQRLGRQPFHIAGSTDTIKTIGWCTGAAQDFIELAANQKLDAYLSGEISEKTVHLAQELGIHYFAAGHHATERYGVQALGEHLAEHFNITHQFIDINNPV